MDTQSTKLPQSKHKYRGMITLMCIVLALVLLVGYAVISWFPSSWGLDHAGAYEGLGALFSGLAFIGVLYALKYQREDLEQQGITIAQQQKEIEAQQKEMQSQRFENSFFQLLKFQRESMQSVRITSKHSQEQELEGAKAFRKAVSELESKFGLAPGTRLQEENILEYIDSIFFQFHASYEFDFGDYFRTLYYLFEFIEKSSIEDKANYLDLVKAQLSTDELSLLFCAGLHESGKEYVSFIEKFALLKDWRAPEALKDYRSRYPVGTYGDIMW